MGSRLGGGPELLPGESEGCDKSPRATNPFGGFRHALESL